MSWRLLQNSLALGLVTMALAGLLGVATAVAVAGGGRVTRQAALALAGVNLALPPFLLTNCWMALLGHQGLLRPWFPGTIYSFGGAVWILALWLWPLTFVAALAVWQRLDRALFEAEPALNRWALFRHLLWPIAAPWVLSAAGLTFLLVLNQFTIPALLQVRVLAAEVWLRFNADLDAAAALLAGLPLVGAAAVLLMLLRRRNLPWPAPEHEGSPALLRKRLGPVWRLAVVVAGLTVSLGCLLPLAHLLVESATWRQWEAAWATGRTALGASLAYAGVTVAAVLTLGAVLRRFPGGGALWILFLTPGVLLGLGLLLALNRPGWFWFSRSVALAGLALVLRYLAPGRAGLRLAAARCDPSLTEAARLEGTSNWRLWLQVHRPQWAWPLALTGYVVWLLSLLDVETVLLVAAPGAETLPTVIFNLLHYGHQGQVNALCLMLLLAAAAPVAIGVVLAAGMKWVRTVQGHWNAGRAAVLGMLLAAGIAPTGCSPDLPSTGDPIESRIFERVEIIGHWGRGPGEFNKPRSVAVDGEDRLYVVDLTGRIQVFGADGRFLRQWQMPQIELGRPKGMGIDAEGNLIVVEPHYARINHFRPDGTLVRQWGEKGIADGQINFPRAVAVNTAGEIWVSEYMQAERVQRFSADGSRWIQTLGHRGEGPGEFNRPEGLAVDGQDRLWVADSCNHRIQLFDPRGRWLRMFGRPGDGPGELSYPYDVRVDPEGHVFVCEFGNSRIQVFDIQGHSLEILGAPGSAPGRFHNPWSLALDSEGNLYVADAMNHRVQKLVRRPKRQALHRPASPTPLLALRP